MVPPLNKDTKDAAVQSEASLVEEEKQRDESGAGERSDPVFNRCNTSSSVFMILWVCM